MNITIKRGDLLTATETVIGHQTNCQASMGAGVAKLVKQKYPEVYNSYRNFCRDYARRDCLGKTQLIQTNRGKFVANIFGQLYYGTQARQTDYKALDSAFADLKQQMRTVGLTSLALPYGIGCGLAAGEWTVVHGLIEKNFCDSEIEVVLYKL